MVQVEIDRAHGEVEPEPLSKAKRARSWETQVIVFVNSTDRLYVESKTRLDDSACKCQQPDL